MLKWLLIILGAPLWFPILISVYAVLLSICIVFWAVIISLWAIFVTLLICSLAGIIACVYFIAIGHMTTGLLLLSASLICLGLAIFMYYICKALTKSTSLISKAFLVGIFRIFK